MSAIFNYNKSKIKAQKIIAYFAAGSINAVLIDENKGTYNPATLSFTGGGADIEHNLICVKLDYKKEQIDGKLILQDDIKIIVSTEGLTVIPTLNHKIKIDSEIWNIVPPIKTLRPTGTTIFYTLQCRK